MTHVTTAQLQASIGDALRRTRHHGALTDAQRTAAVAAIEATAYEIADQIFVRDSVERATFMRACGFDVFVPGTDGPIAAFLAGGPIGDPLGELEDGPAESNGYDDPGDPEIDPSTGEPFDAPEENR